jgi:hypothetical protein
MKMTTSTHQGSAKIYAFPARGRFAVSASVDLDKSAATRTPKPVQVSVGAAWYHEQAILEGEQPRSA